MKKGSFYQEVDLALIELHPDQPRKLFDEAALAELSASLKEGVLQPIIVRPYGNKYQLIIGARRTKAALLAGFTKIPACIIEKVDDSKILEMALTENIQREDLTPLEESFAILKLMKDYGHSMQDVCAKIGKSEDFVRLRLKLISLPKSVQGYISAGKLPIRHAALLVKEDMPEKQEKLAREMIDQSLTYKEAKEKILETVKEKNKNVKKEFFNVTDDQKANLVDIQAKRLVLNLKELSCEKLSYVRRENIRVDLLELKNQIEKTIQTIENLD